MIFRYANWLLIPVITLTIACSLANAGMESPALAKKMSAPCPFHPQQESSQQAPEKPKCLNCLTNSMRMEDRHEVHPNLAVLAILPPPLVFVPPAENSFGSSMWTRGSAPPDSPPSTSVPLRI